MEEFFFFFGAGNGGRFEKRNVRNQFLFIYLLFILFLSVLFYFVFCNFERGLGMRVEPGTDVTWKSTIRRFRFVGFGRRTENASRVSATRLPKRFLWKLLASIKGQLSCVTGFVRVFKKVAMYES